MDRLVPQHALGQFLGKDAPSGQLRKNVGDVDERVPAVGVGGLGLVGGFVKGVHFLSDLGGHLRGYARHGRAGSRCAGRWRGVFCLHAAGVAPGMWPRVRKGQDMLWLPQRPEQARDMTTTDAPALSYSSAAGRWVVAVTVLGSGIAALDATV